MSKTFVMLAGLFIVAAGGMSYAASDTRGVVHDEVNGTALHSSSGECVRTKWMDASDECAPVAALPQVTHSATFSREERTIYSGFNQASLSPQMAQRLDSLASVLKSDDSVKGVRIVGYADRIGSPGYNERLSKKRAENVRQYLASRGLINARVTDTRWFGSRAPTADCPDGMKRPDLISCLQQDRRVEVEIDYAPDKQASR